MKTVITYGTYDLLHEGHIRLLQRAKALGDRLIVGVTSDSYDAYRGKLNVHDNVLTRIANVRATGLADVVLVEEYEGQKVRDVEKFDVDIFAIGSDWQGKFDYLSEYCDVVYLERTKGVSSTELRNSQHGLLTIGIVGSGRIARRFVNESRRVSGVQVSGFFSDDHDQALELARELEIEASFASLQDMLASSDAVYVASPHETHYEYVKAALVAGKHVLCETPITLSHETAKELYALAQDRDLVLLEAAKTAFFTGFRRLIEMAKSGSIGQIRAVDATFTKLVTDGRELAAPYGGALTEMGTYPLLAITKLLGSKYDTMDVHSFFDAESGVDTFTRVSLTYPNALATATVGVGAKSEGDLVITGTRGYLYVPAPWWLTESFEVRFEDTRLNRRFYYRCEGDGLRYEIADFAKLVNAGLRSTYKWRPANSIAVVKMLEKARTKSRQIQSR